MVECIHTNLEEQLFFLFFINGEHIATASDRKAECRKRGKNYEKNNDNAFGVCRDCGCPVRLLRQ